MRTSTLPGSKWAAIIALLLFFAVTPRSVASADIYDPTEIPDNHPGSGGFSPVADASATPRVFISPNGLDATVTLDGSLSYDPEEGPLSYAWSLNGTPGLLATGAVANVVLPV